MTATDVTGPALRAAREECERALRWYRVTCADADLFAGRAARALRADEVAEARAHAQRAADANRARRAAWSEYRGAVARLTWVLGGREA